MHDRLQVARLALRVERPHVRSRRPAHHGKYTLDRLQHTGHAPERERGCAESSHLAVSGIFEPAYKLNGICCRIDAIERRVERVKSIFESVFPHTYATYATHATY